MECSHKNNGTVVYIKWNNKLKQLEKKYYSSTMLKLKNHKENENRSLT